MVSERQVVNILPPLGMEKCEMTQVYGLYRAHNDYDQHCECLEWVWFNKPSLQEISEAMGWKFPECTDQQVLDTVALFKGESITDHCDQISISKISGGKQ